MVLRTIGSIFCLAIVLVPSVASARDVQQRTRAEDDQSTRSFTATLDKQPGGGQSLTTDQRIQRLESIIDTQILDILNRLQTLEQEVQKLRGDTEVQSHVQDELGRKQRDLYVDLDRRLSALEGQIKNITSAAAATPNTPPPTGTSATTAPTGDNADNQQTYQQALDFLYQKQYDKAITVFREYVEKYPKGRYAHVSQYWIAEAYFAQGQLKQSIAEYQKLVDHFPASPKLAEALLKIGEGYHRSNDNVHAQKALEQLINAYPGTEEAKRGQALLQKIKPKPAPPKNKR